MFEMSESQQRPSQVSDPLVFVGPRQRQGTNNICVPKVDIISVYCLVYLVWYFIHKILYNVLIVMDEVGELTRLSTYRKTIWRHMGYPVPRVSECSLILGYPQSTKRVHSMLF